MNWVDQPRTSADERDVVWAPRCRHCLCAVAGFGRFFVFSLTSRFFVNSHLDHSRAWIPACSLTSAPMHRCFPSLHWRCEMWFDCVERKKRGKLPLSKTAHRAFAAAPSF